MSLSRRYLSLNPYELHKHLINTYVLNTKGATNLLKRDTSRDKRDIDVIRENHKFIWEEDDQPITWEERLAKKYYDKLYKEFCIADLSRYKENMVGLCNSCSKKLNYKHKRKEIKRLKRFKKPENRLEEKVLSGTDNKLQPETSDDTKSNDGKVIKDVVAEETEESEIWKAPIDETEESSRDEEFEKYLEHLLL